MPDEVKSQQTLSTEFEISYDGSAIQDGTIDADKFAESLSGISNLIEACNERLPGSKSEVSVKVKGSFRQESFVAEMIVLMSGPTITAIVNCVEIIGFAGSTGLTLFDLIKQTKGKEIEVIRAIGNDQSEVRVVGEVSGHHNIIAPTFVINCYGDEEVRKAANQTVSILQYAGIDNIKSRKNRSIEHPTIVAKSDLPYFKVPESEPEVRESTSDDILIITTCSIEGESTGWRFKYPGKHDFKANVEDKSFLKRIKSGEQSFSNGQIVKARIHEISRKKKRWTPERKIIKILEIVPRQKEEGVFAEPVENRK